jgi:hypothetical protein
MAPSPREPKLNEERRGVLALLANFPHGIMEELLVLAHRFDRSTIGGLLNEGLAMAQREVVTSPSRTTIDVVRIRISDAGRRALEG